VSVDSILFADGGVIGPDRTDIIRHQAEEEAAIDAVIAIVRAGGTDDELKVKLQAAATMGQSPVDRETGRPDFRTLRRSGAAKAALMALQQNGRSGVEHFATAQAAQRASPAISRFRVEN
jgi:hypothetical protein